MTKPITNNATPYYKVRVVLPGAILHLASRDEPHLVRATVSTEGKWSADWLSDPDKGDTIGFIDWPSVVAITWRWSASDA